MPETIGSVFSVERKDKGVAHEELACMLGVSERMLFRYQSGQCKWPDDVLIKAAQILGSEALLAAHPVVQAWIRQWLPDYPEAE